MNAVSFQGVAGCLSRQRLQVYTPKRGDFLRHMEHVPRLVAHGVRKKAGQISLRLGESPCVYYFGHIGYHVDPPYRGQHYARRACELLRPLMEAAGKDSVVITCDPDNLPSRRTCEGLGCELERIVNVPAFISDRWEISPVKCRYIWRLNASLRI